MNRYVLDLFLEFSLPFLERKEGRVDGLKVIGAGAAVGIGKIFSSLIHSVARSPELDPKLFGYAILGFALTEAIALFSLMIS
uniref:hypothetical protein n=1 Tax=Theobroma cacao TaxID=3641 RepID=UPI0021D5369A|nr:hypothetical protein OF223_mgp12 [Theobroma cacao]YP_010500556.1 hypothetical protein OF241_mgp07 [Theobroma grandiflorum]UXB55743.1 hypothetical protein [Theobroma cacao]UXB55789.1 hypothetical protein [Theobroma grandiflorum]